MKILHISDVRIGDKSFISGINSVLLEEIKWENKIKEIESKILIYQKIEENNLYFINKKSLKKDILEYRPDFVIFDGFYIIQHYFIAKFFKKHNIKYYIKPHGAFNKLAQKNSKIKFLKKLIGRILLFNNYVKNSNGLIFLNKMEKQNSIYHNKNEFILPNGIDELDINLKVKERSQNINFIFLSRIDIFNKKLDILLNVILENKEYFIKNNVIFNFYGNGRKKDIKIFNNYLNKISEVVKYHGVIYGDEKFLKLKENDIFILISRYEGMPMSVLEALEMGIPCFISKEVGIGDEINKYNAGWVNEDNKNLFEDLKKSIEEYKIYSENYKNNSLLCSENFKWKNLKSIYLKEYLKMSDIL